MATDRRQCIGRAQNLDLYGITIDHGTGHRMTDTEGRTYIDFLSAASSMPLGYGRQDLIDAYVAQCHKVPHTCTVYTDTEIVHEYARRLTATSGIERAKLLYGAFGSDAIDAALKCARAYTGKRRFLAFERSYHGGGFLSLAASGFPNMKEGLSLSDSFTHLPYPDRSRWDRELSSLEAELRSGDVACLLMETILGDGGVVETTDEFFAAVLPLLHQHGAILVLDEIQTGIGRTGTFWAYERYGITPDLFCAGKALGGGYVPLSACIGKPEIIDSLKEAQGAFTFAGHAASCAVGLALLDAFNRENILANVRSQSELLRSTLQAGLTNNPLFAEVRGRGLLLGVSLRSNHSIGPVIGLRCLERGLYLGYYGQQNNVLRVHPHLNIDTQTAIDGATILVEAMRDVASDPSHFLGERTFKSFFSR
ncbi:MAG: aspartate aminotransferase family protein [Planctomycetota bacterium]